MAKNIKTKTVVFNNWEVEILPYSRPVVAAAARECTRKGATVHPQNMTLESLNLITVEGAKAVVRAAYELGEPSPVDGSRSRSPKTRDEINDQIEAYDAFSDFLLAESAAFQAEIEGAWGVNAKN